MKKQSFSLNFRNTLQILNAHLELVIYVYQYVHRTYEFRYMQSI